MAIYDRFGRLLEIVKVATAEDVLRLQKTELDAYDHKALSFGFYVVGRDPSVIGNYTDRIYHYGFLRADGGLAEIRDEVAKLKAPAGVVK
jgi:hypothetical protein